MGAELTGRRNGLDQWLLAVAGDVEEKVSVGGMEPALKRSWREATGWRRDTECDLKVFLGVDLVN